MKKLRLAIIYKTVQKFFQTQQLQVELQLQSKMIQKIMVKLVSLLHSMN